MPRLRQTLTASGVAICLAGTCAVVLTTAARTTTADAITESQGTHAVSAAANGVHPDANRLATMAIAPGPHVERAAAPVVADTVDAAPDYATEAFSDPWDYNNADDVHFEEPPQANAKIAGGLFSYDAAGTYPWFDPLPYLPGSTPQERDGPTHPIDADYFTHVSFAMYSSRAGWGGIDWSVCNWGKKATCSGQMGFPTVKGWHVYDVVPVTDQARLPAVWGGKVLSLRIIPIAGQPGTHIAVDWVRVYHPQDPISVTVPVPTPGQRVSVVAQRVADHGGQALTVPVTKFDSTSPSATVPFDYSRFPPGVYTLRAIGPHGTVGSPSSAVRITAPPTPVVDWPNAQGAGDYATEVLGHPWDFSSMASVGTHLNMANLAILPGGVLRGQNAGHEIDNPYFFLPTKGPINGSLWHRLTVHVKYDGPFGLTGGPTGGAVGRLIWYLQTDKGRDDQNLQDLVLYPGWNTITVDLATNPTAAITDDTQKAKRIGWGGQLIESLRWDPNEDVSHRVWYVDSIRLAGDPVSHGGADITFHDPGLLAGETATAYLTTRRFGTDTVGTSQTVAVKPGANKMHITSVPGLGGRECWARIVVTSANGTATQWSTGPVQVVS